MSEEWRDIPGWPAYQVSSGGRVKRLACAGADGRKLAERLITVCCGLIPPQGYPYLYVNLGGAANLKTFSVARLVLTAFVGAPAAGQECRHLDDNPRNCALSNLAWGSRAENRADAIRNGKMAVGERNGAAKLTAAQVQQIRAAYTPFSRRYGLEALARLHGVHSSTIADIVHNKTWRLSA